LCGLMKLNTQADCCHKWQLRITNRWTERVGWVSHTLRLLSLARPRVHRFLWHWAIMSA